MAQDGEVAWRAVRGPLRLEDVLYQARRSSRIAPVQVVRARLVLGADHIRQAARLAARARREGRAQADEAEVEFLRYLSGERQIQSALRKMGIEDGQQEAVVIGLGPRGDDAVAHFCHSLGLRDGTLRTPDVEGLRAYGITDDQMAATTPERRMDLVLEAVAAVDLMR